MKVTRGHTEQSFIHVVRSVFSTSFSAPASSPECWYLDKSEAVRTPHRTT
jgi:hypothetical protein